MSGHTNPYEEKWQNRDETAPSTAALQEVQQPPLKEFHVDCPTASEDVESEDDDTGAADQDERPEG
ncbi:hypothetical protein LTR37_007875 [Vermiconidia calcicola]|uniref:Uncharacterized protein n=1 Tax=Vermiconidia calcicola TaxID=1690605 RepID=A0ACC3NDF8_9PEZI|nr:hypothetical protein LTR37_007875 [Vermiconidia calcicola]